MIRTIKEVHNKDVCMFLIGNFYHVYGRDADIISYLLDYKIKDVDSVKECGFPISSINKIKARLEENKINYLLIDRRNNYEVDEKSDNKDLNRYQSFYEKSNKYINLKRRIQNINTYMLENLSEMQENDILKRIEDILYLAREV